jgi:putative drug exporter of the RND superfamily
MFRNLARWCYRHAWTVVATWVLLLVGVNALAGVVGAAFDSSFGGTDSESGRGFETLETYFPGAGSQLGGSIVFEAEQGVNDPEVVAAMTAMFDEAGTIDGVTIVSPYSEFGVGQISDDGTIAFAQVNLSPDVDQTESTAVGAELVDIKPEVDGLRVEIGGSALGEFKPPETELIGLAFAIIVLIVAFGSVLAMGLPIGVALAGVATGGIGLVTLLTNVLTIPDFAPLIGVMIGLGIGIDYALFIVTRYRERTKVGVAPDIAVEEAMDTAGRAVLVAGITVVLSLLGMVLIGLSFITGLGISAAITVAVTMTASLTLLPSLLSLLHTRLETTRWRGLLMAGFAALALLGLGLGIPALGAAGALLMVMTLLASLAIRPLRAKVPDRKERPLRETLAYRWSRVVQARPWTGVLVGGGFLVLLSVPIFGLRLGFSDEGNFPEETTTRQAFDLIAEGFGPGFNGPFILAVETNGADATGVLESIVSDISADPGVQQVSPPFPNDPAAPAAYVVQIVPTTSPQDEATEATVVRVREITASNVEGTPIEANLTGIVPANIDISDFLASRIPVFFGAVLAVSFLLLMVVFRSLLVPLKAVIMNMLSISAAYGVVVAIFQWGWLGGLTGIEPAPIEPFVPMMLFAIVFGLSMDYEVFLLSRIKEEYDRTGDPVNSVADGLAMTARVITAAASIMVVVFGSFLLEDDRIIRLFGTALALAVFLDATLVRMLLVPATMELLGSRNWWLPKWLDRIIPVVHIEGKPLEDPTTESVADDDREPATVG